VIARAHSVRSLIPQQIQEAHPCRLAISMPVLLDLCRSGTRIWPDGMDPARFEQWFTEDPQF